MTRHRPMDFDTRSYLAELRREKRGNSAAQVRARTHTAAEADAAAWNAAHPVGTEVTVTMDDGTVRRTRTRSVAWRVCDHASVMVEGIAGGYLLSRVKAVGAPDPSAFPDVMQSFGQPELGEVGA